jgi:hypothetical protein
MPAIFAARGFRDRAWVEAWVEAGSGAGLVAGAGDGSVIGRAQVLIWAAMIVPVNGPAIGVGAPIARGVASRRAGA